MSQQNPPIPPEDRDPVADDEVISDKEEARSLTETSPLLRWLDNFWYHYKWTVIVVAFFVTVGIICTVQLISRPRYDTNMVMATHYRMNNEERAAFESLLNEMCPEDYNEDGEKKVNFMIYQVYSEEEFLAEAESYENESDQFVINNKYNTDEYNNFNQYTMTGETSVYILSPYLYGLLVEGNRLKPLSEVYTDGNLPVGARSDGYGINLAETDFYKYNPAAQCIPDTAIICLHRPTIGGGSSDEDIYARQIALFRAMADFHVEED